MASASRDAAYSSRGVAPGTVTTWGAAAFARARNIKPRITTEYSHRFIGLPHFRFLAALYYSTASQPKVKFNLDHLQLAQVHGKSGTILLAPGARVRN